MEGTRHSEEQIITILKQGEAGLAAAELCRQHGITEQTYYRWKAKYGGMDSGEAKETEAALIGASSISRHQGSRLRGIPTFVHDANTNRLASLYADHKLSNLAVLFPANGGPGLARLIFDQTVNRSVAELLQVESPRGY